MTNSLSLLVAILVSLQCTFEASAQDGNILDNNLQPNAVSPAQRRVNSLSMVRIKEAPPTTVNLEPGKRLVLECTAMGKPLPSVQWMKNGEPAIDYEEDTNEILPVHPTSLGFLVSKLVVTSASSGDVFTCVATSRAKQVSASTTVLNVEGNEDANLLTLQKLFRLPSKPVITTYLQTVLQNIGTDVVLPCRVHSFTASQLIWQDNEENIIYGNSRIQVLPSGDLLIRNLRWSDMGGYSCLAKNMYGKDLAETFVYPLKPE